MSSKKRQGKQEAIFWSWKDDDIAGQDFKLQGAGREAEP